MMLRDLSQPLKGARVLLASLPALCFSATAAPLDDAQAHFKAIASGDVAAASQGYADQAELQWIGGPLDGRYVGVEAIRAVWARFTQAQGPLQVNVTELDEAANSKGATVTARVLFEGKAPLWVRYVLSYRAGQLVQETWQIELKPAKAS
jgi:ketosteroid isomerase-like protein